MRQHRLVAALLILVLAPAGWRTAAAQTEADPWVDPPAPVQPLAPLAPTAPGPSSPDLVRLMMLQEQQRSPWAALFIEMVPGCGSLYADDPHGALVTWGLILGGAVAIAFGVSKRGVDDGSQSRTDGTAAMPLLLRGLAVAAFGRGYGFVNAYRATERHNAALRERFGLPTEREPEPWSR